MCERCDFEELMYTSIVERGKTHPLSKKRSSFESLLLNTYISKIDRLAESFVINIILQVYSKMIEYFGFYEQVKNDYVLAI